MSWAAAYIAQLRAGETARFRPRGNSMSGRIESGQLCTVEPLAVDRELAVGDIVLCRVHGRDYLHLVTARRGSSIQIGNARGHVNGWVSPRAVYGICTNVEP